MTFILDVSTIVGLITGLVFGLLARATGRSTVQWALGGAFFGLVITAICMGLGNAMTIRYTHLSRTRMIAEAVGCSAVLIAVVSALFAVSLWPHRWRERAQ